MFRWHQRGVKTTKAKPRAGETPMVDLAIPEFGYQNHISADCRHRLIRRCRACRDTSADLLDPGNTASEVWADTGYRSKRNEDVSGGPRVTCRTSIRSSRLR